MKSHLSHLHRIIRHWHIHLSLWGVLASALILITAGAGGVAVVRHVHAGYRPAPLPPAIQITGGPPLPASFSLARYLVRLHNQGSSNSCVGQTLSTMDEITTQERNHKLIAVLVRRTTRVRVPLDTGRPGRPARRRSSPARHRAAPFSQKRHAHAPFHWVTRHIWVHTHRTIPRHNRYSLSAGFIYDLANHGVDQGASYDDAFSVLINEGDPRLRDFPHDGIDWWAQPSAWTLTRASPFRFLSYRAIEPWDRHTIEAEIAAGRPLALALPWHDGLYQHFGDSSVVTADPGPFHFWHSVTVYGYTPAGVCFVNSWGPGYGIDGRACVSWGFLAGSPQIALITAMP